MRRQRQRATYPVICKRLTAMHQPVGVSLFARSATPSAHTVGPPIGQFGPKISPVSVSQPVGVISRWLLLFGCDLPGLASVGEGDGEMLSGLFVFAFFNSADRHRDAQGNGCACVHLRWVTSSHDWRDIRDVHQQFIFAWEHPESIRTFRQEERRQATDRQRVRRARRRLRKKSTGRT